MPYRRIEAKREFPPTHLVMRPACPLSKPSLTWHAVRKGLLSIAAALALAAPATAHAAPDRLALGAIVVYNSYSIAVPYTVDTAGVTRLKVEIKLPGRPDYEFYNYYWELQPSGTLYVASGGLDGEVHVRVTAEAQDFSPLESQDVSRLITMPTTILSLIRNFGVQEVGAVERKDARFEGWDKALDIRNLRLEGDPDFRIVSENCTGRSVGPTGCEVTIEFTPTVVGDHKTRLLFDANGTSGSYDVTGTGKFTPSEPLLPPPPPAPQPTPTPTPVAPDPPELVFNSAPSRKDNKLFGLKLVNLRPGSTITVKCAKGCSAKSLTKRNVSGTVSLASFAKRRLKVGTTIRVTITAPGAKPIVTTLKVRANREPSVRTT